MWECTGGSAVAGDDSLTTALKETREEIGIELRPENGRLFKRYNRYYFDNSGDIVDVWLFGHETSIRNVVLQPGETCGAMWANAELIKMMIAEGTFIGREIFAYTDELFEYCGLSLS